MVCLFCGVGSGLVWWFSLVFLGVLFLGLLVGVGFVCSWVPGVGDFDGLNCLCSVCLFRRCCLGLVLWLV